MSWIRVIIVIGLTATCLAGCRSDPALDRSSQAVNRLLTSRDKLLEGSKRLGESLSDLQKLKNAQADLRPAFNAFRSHHPVLLEEADRVRLESEEIRFQSESHISAWENDLGTLNNQQLRQIGENRASQVRSQYARLLQLYQQVNDAYLKYLTQTRDLEVYLSNDLNFPALQTARVWIEQTEQSGQDLIQRIDLLAIELGRMINVLSPVPVPQHLPATTQTSNVDPPATIQ